MNARRTAWLLACVAGCASAPRDDVESGEEQALSAPSNEEAKACEAASINGMSNTLTAFTAPQMLFAAGASVEPLQRVEIRPHIPFAINGHTIVIAPIEVGTLAGRCP